MCLYECLTMWGDSPNGVLDLFPQLNQGITDLLEGLRCDLEVLIGWKRPRFWFRFWSGGTGKWYLFLYFWRTYEVCWWWFGQRHSHQRPAGGHFDWIKRVDVQWWSSVHGCWWCRSTVCGQHSYLPGNFRAFFMKMLILGFNTCPPCQNYYHIVCCLLLSLCLTGEPTYMT